MERMSITFLALVVLGCTTTMPLAAQSGSTSKDSELVFPADYKSYAAFLHGIQKPDAVRDLYINPTGASAEAGQPFANGSMLVMEIWLRRIEPRSLSCKRKRDGEKAPRRM